MVAPGIHTYLEGFHLLQFDTLRKNLGGPDVWEGVEAVCEFLRRQGFPCVVCLCPGHIGS